MGRKSKKEGMYVYMGLVHFAMQQKLTNILKQLYSKKKKSKIKDVPAYRVNKALYMKLSVLSDTLQPHGHSPRNSPGQNTGVDSLSLLQGIFPTQGSNPGLRIGGRFFTS